jgi:regulator of chromosome condensation
LVKIVSGSHHSLALTSDKKVFAWGDAESGKIGRMLNTRAKNVQAMKIEAVGAKDAVDVFCSNNSSFYLNSKGSVFAWGLNNHGQLGIGNKMNTANPTLVKELEGINVK